MPRPATLLSWALVAALVLAYGCEQRKVGLAQAGEREARRVLDSLAHVARARDTVYVRDTVRLWRTVTAYDTARVTDTLTRNDTVFVPRAVADAAITACVATVLTCEGRVADRDQQLATWERRWATREKPRAGWIVWAERGAIAYLSFKVGQASAP